MKVTLSIIKADIGSIGGHICPSRQLVETVQRYVAQHSSMLIDHYVSSTGDDIAILMSHRHGVGHEAIHKLAWDALVVLRVLAPRAEPAWTLLTALWRAWRQLAWGLAPCPPRVWRT